MRGKFELILITVGCAVLAFSAAAQPNWIVNPQDYEFSMTITGKVNTDGYSSVDENDVIAAFVGNECRGIAKLKYEDFKNEFFSYLMVYGNTPGELLTFKIFDASENLVVGTHDTLNFIVNNVVGSPDEPFVFSSNLLNNQAEILSFSIPEQAGETIIDGNSIVLKTTASDLNGLAAGFELSQGAKVYVAGEEQISNETTNDFSQEVEYVVVSEDLISSVIYTVKIEIDENDAPTAIFLSNEIISETAEKETIVAILSAEDKDDGDNHTFQLIVGDGTNDSENSFFTISENNLILSKSLNFENQETLNVLIRVTDSRGGFFDQGFAIKITDANEPPRFSSKPSSFVVQDEIFVYAIVVSDSENDEIALIIEDLPTWLNYNPLTKIISGTPGNEEVGDHKFNIKASDGIFESVQVVVFSVINKNDPPEINFFLNDQFFRSGQYNEIQLPINCMTDPDNEDTLKFSLGTINNSSLPEWLYFNPENLMLSGIPPPGFIEKLSLKLTASDEGNLKEFIVFGLQISPATKISTVKEKMVFNCYPNPVENELIVEFYQDNINSSVIISTISGQVISSFKHEIGKEYNISFADKNAGIYLISFNRGDKVYTKKIIKK